MVDYGKLKFSVLHECLIEMKHGRQLHFEACMPTSVSRLQNLHK